MLPCGHVVRSEQKHQRSYWNWNPCLLIQNMALYTMAGLVYSAYHGCLQERYPISHSSCFDVWHRGLPVPLHKPGICSLWDSRLWERPAPPRCPAPPQSLQSPNEDWRLWSCQCTMKDPSLTALFTVTQEACRHTPTASRTFFANKLQQNGQHAAIYPPKMGFVFPFWFTVQSMKMMNDLLLFHISCSCLELLLLPWQHLGEPWENSSRFSFCS